MMTGPGVRITVPVQGSAAALLDSFEDSDFGSAECTEGRPLF